MNIRKLSFIFFVIFSSVKMIIRSLFSNSFLYNKSIYCFICFIFFIINFSYSIAQRKDSLNDFKSSGWLSFGARSTLSSFGDEGSGVGSGGQFRVQMSNYINTDWFFDYISINVNNKVRSEYYHIGWSVIYYPLPKQIYPKIFQPYILAGHCFDYNKMTSMELPTINKDRWGSAVQAGLGFHFNLSSRFDITFMSQYMIHFTKSLHAETDTYPVKIDLKKESTLQGHLLTTISLNYKIFKIWKRKK